MIAREETDMLNRLNLPLRGALIGFGKVAEMAHLPALASREDFRIVAVAEPLPERREQAQALLPGVRFYEQAGELLAREEPLDFVDICTPPRDHTDLALAALDRGCHVLCEKPLTLAPGDFAVLRQAAVRAARTLVTVHNWKHAPLLAQARELAAGGGIGAVHMVEWEVHRTSGGGGGLTDWRQESGQALGGILIDHGWHAFYLLMEWAGAVPKALNARLMCGAGPGGIDQEAEVGLRFPACQARLFLTWQARERRNWGRLSGSRGEIVMDDDRLVLAADDRPAETLSFPAKVSAGSHHPDWMGGVLDEFLGEIGEPDRRGQNLREAELCARLIRLAYRSHKAGGDWLDVEAHEAPR
jgi:predicted dehydrogenase